MDSQIVLTAYSFIRYNEIEKCIDYIIEIAKNKKDKLNLQIAILISSEYYYIKNKNIKSIDEEIVQFQRIKKKLCDLAYNLN